MNEALKQNLLGLDAAGLERFFEAQGEKPFRARQVQRWIHQHLHGVALLLTGQPDMAIVLYALPLLPGVALHELSHALMAAVLRVRSANLTIIPRRQPDGHIRLGSVQVEQVDVIRLSLIGIAPLLLGCAAVLMIIQYAFGISGLAEAIRTHDPSTMFAALRMGIHRCEPARRQTRMTGP